MQGYRAKTWEELSDGPPGGFLKRNHPDTGEVMWHIKDPLGNFGNISGHEIVEHEDGMISVIPSILQHKNNVSEEWHGFLENGVWREV